jgi:MFS family permease
MAISFFSGYILDNIPFPFGYQIIFGIGAFGAAMSSLHLYFVKPLQTEYRMTPPAPQSTPIPQTKSPRRIFSALRLDIWSTPYRNVLLALLAFHLTQFLPIPVFPLFNVRVLHLKDDHIGTGTALFYLTMLIGSLRSSPIIHKHGYKKVTGLGVAGMAIYPLLLAFAQEVWHFYAISLVGGFMWAWVNASYANYMLEGIPPSDRPSHLAWYTIVFNISLLAGSLIGPLIASQTGLASALILFAVLRFLAGLGILRWG